MTNEIKIQKRQTKYSGIVEDIYVNGKLHVSAVGKKMQSTVIAAIKKQLTGKLTICWG